MKKIYETFLISAGAAIGFMFGELDGLFYALIAFVALDYMSGVAVAVARKCLSSEIGFRGICKKIMVFMVVAVAHIIDEHIIQSGAGLRTAAIFLFIANEGVSLLENAGEMGVPFPEKLLSVLQQIKPKIKNKDREDIKNDKSVD
ncbi:MAG: phage holin family protein [Oscillospiraceae bacterium]|nr:phage holin family protein [Oscillospiraceae bacterium]